nr:hypothetical protein GTC16762_16130 [Pigmentibacter ruber]
MQNEKKYLESYLKLLDINPHFQKIKESKNFKNYFEPSKHWTPDEINFPFKKNLLSKIINNIKKIYDHQTTCLVQNQLELNFCSETGSHISLPRSHDKIGKITNINHNLNTLIFQGTILSAAKSLTIKNKIHFSMGTSRVYLNNANSAAYIQFDKDDGYVRLVSNRWKDTPQIFIPPFHINEIQSLKNEAFTFATKKYTVNDRGYAFCKKNITKIFSFFEEVAISNLHDQKSSYTFSEQISKIHANIFNEILKETGVKQVTIDYEKLSWEFLIELLEDKTSLTYIIFSNKQLFDSFLDIFSEIQTGWQKGQFPFDLVVEKNGIKKLSPILFSEFDTSDRTIFLEKILELLKENKIIPKGVLQFFIFMVEGGLLPIGGMNQSNYCTKIRDLSVQFMCNNLGKYERSNALKKLPCEIMSISPAWGFMNNSNNLFSFSDFLEKEIAITKDQLQSILDIPAEDALFLSIPILSQFMLHENIAPEFENKFIQEIKEKGNILIL